MVKSKQRIWLKIFFLFSLTISKICNSFLPPDVDIDSYMYVTEVSTNKNDGHSRKHFFSQISHKFDALRSTFFTSYDATNIAQYLRSYRMHLLGVFEW